MSTSSGPAMAGSSSRRRGSPTASESGSALGGSGARGFVPSHSQTAALAGYLQTQFLPSVLPTHAEYAEKEQVRLRLEALANSVLPGARLLPFGSTANGLSLRNSDMDLCCVMESTQRGEPKRPPSDLVEILGEAIQKAESRIYVKMLPRARIPIIKLTLPPSSGAPFGIQCDIGFENRLALENTRLLLTYALTDTRLRTMVLFIKVWTKRRKINNPYVGTLSSYGYVLMVIYYLTHIVRPPVLPNLQRIPPLQNLTMEEIEIDGHDIYFFDDVELLSQIWTTSNTDNVGELLTGFFHFFAKQFEYAGRVISIRSDHGALPKEVKGWHTDRDAEQEIYGGPRDLNRFCIEDPFQTEYNVARTVTRDGLYTIRGELQRACKMLCGRSERVASIIAELCEEREDVIIPCPPGASSTGGRRQSAPSPASIAGALPNDLASTQAADFRAWMQASAAGPSSSVASTSATLPGAAQLPGAAPYVHRMPMYNQSSGSAGAAAAGLNTSDYGGTYRSHHQPRGHRSQPAYPQYGQPQQQPQRYHSNSNNSHTRQGYHRQQHHNTMQSYQQQQQQPRSATLGRRSSWDGSHSPAPSQQDTLSGRQQQHQQPMPQSVPSFGYSQPLRPIQTAPTSPIMGATASGYMPSSSSSRLGIFGTNSATGSGGRSHSHSSLDRRHMPGPPFQPVPRPLESISFGNFHSSMINVMDTALARAEDRRRRGMQHVDSEHETITFGDVRVFRKSSNPSRSNSPVSGADEELEPSSTSPRPPRRGTILPQVLEAIEVNRPNTPGVPSVTDRAPPPVHSLPSPRSLVNGGSTTSLSSLTDQVSKLDTHDSAP